MVARQDLLVCCDACRVFCIVMSVLLQQILGQLGGGGPIVLYCEYGVLGQSLGQAVKTSKTRSS